MKILYITNMYPVDDYIYFGIHVKEQIEAVTNRYNIDNDIYFINGRESKFNYIKSIWEIKRLIALNGYDLIHIHYGLSGLYRLFIKSDVPCVFTLHSGEIYQKKSFLNHLIQKRITFRAIRAASKVIVLNDDMEQMLSFIKDRLVKLPCGTNLSLFKERHLPRSEKFIIGFPGNKGRKEKNYDLFKKIVDAFKATAEVEVIEFHNLSREEVIDSLNKLDVLLMTSLVEGSPQIIKEAMACNKPIISTNVGDVSDLLWNVENCYVVNSFAYDDFLQPLEDIHNLGEKMRISNGRDKLIQMRLDSEGVSSRLYEIYQTEV